MSPSSSLRAAALVGLLSLVLASAGAQQQGLYAVLLRGPEQVWDLQMYPPNPLTGQAGEYQLPGPDEKRVSVLYTREHLVLPQAWRARGCGSLRLLEVADHEPYSLCYADPEGAFTVFFSFPDGPEEPQRCRFVESFLGRVQVLRGLLKDDSEAPFPGVLEMRGQ